MRLFSEGDFLALVVTRAIMRFRECVKVRKELEIEMGRKEGYIFSKEMGECELGHKLGKGDFVRASTLAWSSGDF